MKQRLGFISLASIPAQKDNKGQKICLNCNGFIKSRRRKYCSSNCADEFFAKHNFSAMRHWIVEKRGAICEICKKTFYEYSETLKNSYPQWGSLVIDHKIPIALGGEEFNPDNLQILCLDCNKIKTANDLKEISKKRKDEKTLSHGQTSLLCITGKGK